MDYFITNWHNIDDIVPDNDSNIFFVVNDTVYAGKYDNEVNGFMMADGKGFAAEETTGQWMYIPPLITPKSYPSPEQRIVVSINEYNEDTPFKGVFVTGTFVENRLGRFFSVEDCYDIVGEVDWKQDIDGWQPVPEAPMTTAKPVPDTQSVNMADVNTITVNESVEVTPQEAGMEGFPGDPVVLPKDGEDIDVRRFGCDFYQKGNYNAAENSFIYNNNETGEPESVSFDEIEVWEPARIYK